MSVVNDYPQLQTGVGFLRAKECSRLFGIEPGSWLRWVREGKVRQGVLLSRRNRSWSAAYIQELLDQAVKGQWPIEPPQEAGQAAKPAIPPSQQRKAKKAA